MVFFFRTRVLLSENETWNALIGPMVETPARVIADVDAWWWFVIVEMG